MDPTCYSMIQVCAFRIGALAASGAPLVGASNMYVSGGTNEIGVNVVLTEGDSKELPNGCGGLAAVLRQPDKISRVDTLIRMTHLDGAAISLATRQAQLTIGTVVGGGYEFPGPTDEAGGDGVSLEFWCKLWDDDAAAGNVIGDPLYAHFVFPRQRYTINSFTANNDFAVIPLAGRGSGNPNFADGPAGDITEHAFVQPGWYMDDVIPATSCALLAIAA